MTYDDLKRANEISNEIFELKNKRNKLNDFIDRVNQVTPQCANSIQIQIAESYMSTPQPYVFKDDLIKLIKKQIGEYNYMIAEKEDELSSI